MDTSIDRPDPVRLLTKRQTLGQVLICATGCCCNRPDKGKPSIPVDWLKNEWRERRLLRHIQLTIAGCLGPCDVFNVVTIVTPQETIWLGGITEEWPFVLLRDWAVGSADRGELIALPGGLRHYIFDRWHPQPAEAYASHHAKL